MNAAGSVGIVFTDEMYRLHAVGFGFRADQGLHAFAGVECRPRTMEKAMGSAMPIHRTRDVPTEAKLRNARPDTLDLLEQFGITVTIRWARSLWAGATDEFCRHICSGCVRTVKLLEDGRRLIGAFLWPGDLFGIDDLSVMTSALGSKRRYSDGSCRCPGAQSLDTSTATGRLMLSVIGAVGQAEREAMLERQREGIAKAKRQSRYEGRVPTGAATGCGGVSSASGLRPSEIAVRPGIGQGQRLSGPGVRAKQRSNGWVRSCRSQAASLARLAHIVVQPARTTLRANASH